MDRQIVFPGSIPLDTDILNIQRNAMIAQGFLAQAMLGTGTVVNGLACTPTSPASMAVNIGPGMITSLQTVDASAFGSLAPDTADNLVKTGINLSTVASTTLGTISAPGTAGQSMVYLISAGFSETDTTAVVLPYYNASNPAVAYSGPANSGAAQNTQRIQRATLTLTAGTAATTGSQAIPATPSGNVPLWAITLANGASTITAGNIAVVPTAPFIPFALPQLRPGFASGVQTYGTHGSYNWIVPAFVTQIEVELWGAGTGSWASISGIAGGGGSGGGYCRKRITGLTPGSSIAIVIGQGGGAGVSGTTAPTAGGTSTFGGSLTAYGGTVNPLGTVGTPALGNLAGYASGGDLNLYGGDGGAGLGNETFTGGTYVGNQGGYGGEGPLSGGVINSGSFGTPGRSPGGGASGAGTGASGVTPYNGAAGADGYCIVRW
jgi:hypothetical protein